MPPGNRERVPDDLLEESYRSGVVQRDSNGDWRIINRQSKVFWKPRYDSKQKAENALKAYQAQKN